MRRPAGSAFFAYPFGAPIAGGDLDGDGFADVVVGDGPGNGGDGAAYLFRGSSAGIPTTPSAVLRGPVGEQRRVGISVAVVGDTRGDGHAHLVLLGDGWFGPLPRAYVYADTSSVAQTIEFPVDVPYSEIAIVDTGDLDGDGRTDLAFGVPNTDLADPTFARIAAFYSRTTPTVRTTPDVAIANPSSGPATSLTSILVGANVHLTH